MTTTTGTGWRAGAAKVADQVATRREEYLRLCRNAADNAVLDRLEAELAVLPVWDTAGKMELIRRAESVLSEGGAR